MSNMKTEELIAELKGYLPKDEQYVGAFTGTYIPVWGYFFFGSFAYKYYRVAVSNQKFYFHKLDLLGKIKETNAFNQDEIDKLIIKKKLIGYKFIFKYKTGKKMPLVIPFRKQKEGVILNDELLQYLKSKFAA